MSVHRVQRSNRRPAYEVRWSEGTANRSRQFDRLQDANDWRARRRPADRLSLRSIKPTYACWGVGSP